MVFGHLADPILFHQTADVGSLFLGKVLFAHDRSLIPNNFSVLLCCTILV
jgi:hypothetical protein